VDFGRPSSTSFASSSARPLSSPLPYRLGRPRSTITGYAGSNWSPRRRFGVQLLPRGGTTGKERGGRTSGCRHTRGPRICSGCGDLTQCGVVGRRTSELHNIALAAPALASGPRGRFRGGVRGRRGPSSNALAAPPATTLRVSSTTRLGPGSGTRPAPRLLPAKSDDDDPPPGPYPASRRTSPADPLRRLRNRYEKGTRTNGSTGCKQTRGSSK